MHTSEIIIAGFDKSGNLRAYKSYDLIKIPEGYVWENLKKWAAELYDADQGGTICRVYEIPDTPVSRALCNGTLMSDPTIAMTTFQWVQLNGIRMY